MFGRQTEGGLAIAFGDIFDSLSQIRTRHPISDPPNSTPTNANLLSNLLMRQIAIGNQLNQ
jgi:hypothetical protein